MNIMESLILSAALELTYIMIYPEFGGPRLNTHSKSNEIETICFIQNI